MLPTIMSRFKLLKNSTMIYSLPHKKFKMIATVALIGFLFVSCGSYQQASYYDNDGIYNSGSQQVTEGSYSTSQPKTQQQTNTYGEYFSEKANQYQEVLDSEIFTDVDSYYGGTNQDSIAPASKGNYFESNNDYNGYGGWGDNPTSVSINVYNGGYGYYSPWYGGYYGGYAGYWGYGGWYNPWYGGYYGVGWGYGYPGWGYGGGWYGGYYPYYPYNPYYPYYGYNGYRHYGYTTGRRGYYNNNYLTENSARRSYTNTVSNRNTNARYRTGTNTKASTSTARRYSDYSNSTAARRTVGVDAAEQNRSYRTSRSTRAVPTYSSSNGNTGVSRGSTYSNANGNSNRSTYRSSAPTGSSSRPSTVSPSTSRSSGNTSARSSSSGSYRSSGSSGAVRSSSGSSGGGSRRN